MPYTRAQLLEAVRTDHPEFKSVDDNHLFAAIAVDHPDMAKGISELQDKPAYEPPRYGPTGATASQVASDQAVDVLKGIPQAVTGIPGMIGGAASAIGQALTGGGTGKGMEMLKGAVQPITTSARGAGALAAPSSVQAPSDQDWSQAAQGSGAMLGGQALGNIISGVPAAAKVVGNAVTSPEAMMTRAAANRAPLPRLSPSDVAQQALTTAVGSGVGHVIGGPPGAAIGGGLVEGTNLLRRTNLYRGGKATLQEAIANALASKKALPDTPTLSASPSNPIEMANPPLRGPGPLADQRLPVGPPQDIPMENLPDLSQPNAPPNITAQDLNRWMNVQPKQLVHGANPAEQILKDNLLGPNKAATLSNVDREVTAEGQNLSSMLDKASSQGAQINAEDHVIGSMNDATKTIGKRTDAGFQAALSNVLDDILNKYPNLNKLSPTEAHALKKDIGDAIHWDKGTPYEADLNRMLLDMYGRLNKSVLEKVPEAAQSQARWGNLYEGLKSLKMSILRDAVGRGTGDVPKPVSKGTMNLMEQLTQTLSKAKGQGTNTATTVYHGSPHMFDKFDAGKIGTGEGGQAFGHGLYFAEQPKVAQEYAGNQGRVYSTELPDQSINKMLDWDKPISQQHPDVQVALKNLGFNDHTLTGKDVYDALIERHLPDAPPNGVPWSIKEASRTLHKANIPGIKYLDQGSRAAGEGTRNFVVFHHDALGNIAVSRKYIP